MPQSTPATMSANTSAFFIYMPSLIVDPVLEGLRGGIA